MARNPSKKVDKHRHDEDKLGAAGGIKKADGKAGKGKAKGKNKRKDRIETAQKRRKIKGAKQKFWAVKVGRAPGVYTSEAAYREQVEGFTGADARSFRTEKLANAYLIDSVVKLVTEEASPAKGGSREKGVHFDKPNFRGFALGFTREAGRSVLTKPPTFSISRPAPAYLPDTTGPRPVSAQPVSHGVDVANGEAAAAHEPAVDLFGLGGGASTSGRGSGERYDDEATQGLGWEAGGGKGALDDDFVPFDVSETRQARAGGARADGDSDQPAAKTEWLDHELPWYRSNVRIGSGSLRLHNEIVELTQLLRPTPEEDAQRREAHKLLADVVQDVFPGCSLDIFGSFATGLHLPTSDVDCVILNSNIPESQVPTALQGLGRKLQQQDWVKDLEVVPRAKVPIAKLVIMPYGLKFDISIGKRNGLDAAVLIRQHLVDWPVLRPLVTILKLYLQQREMNETYTGGLGSFALITTVVAFLQLHQSRVRALVAGGRKARVGPLEQNLGLLLIDYFRFYGRSLGYKDVGVSCADGGYCYRKESFGFQKQPRDRGDRFSVMDPLDPSNDVSRGAFNSFLVRNSFDHAYNMLTAPNFDRGRPILGMILRLNEVLAIRPPPA